MSETATRNPKAQAKADKAYAKANRPWYKKKRFWLLGIVVIIVLISALTANGGDDASDADSGGANSGAGAAAPAQTEAAAPAETEAAAPAEKPTVVTAEQMLSDLESNALAAADTYDGKLVTVTGTLNNIDASGNYFSLKGSPEDLTFTPVTINIDESHRDTVKTFGSDEEITVTGKVTGVGEVLGYSIDAENID